MLKQIITVSIFISLLSLNVSGTSASEINLPRSGADTCYSAAGSTIACSGTGQDGAIQAGQPWPSPRFTAANGAVTDNLTGLVWLQDANCYATVGGVLKFPALTWADALTWSNAMASGYCDLNDGSTAGQWRLPTRLEFESLMDVRRYEWGLPSGHPFKNVPNVPFWTSTTYAADSAWAWSIFLGGQMNPAPKSTEYYVWPVRGGQ